MQKARRHRSSLLRPLVSARFQVLFHSLTQGSFHLSLTVLVHYRSLRSIQPYQMVLAVSRKISRVPRYSGYYQDQKFLRVRDYHSLWYNFPEISTSNLKSMLQSYNPNVAETTLVWALPRSIATTQGITIVFSSSGYLDVSVRRVCPHCWVPGLHPGGFPHSEIYGYKGYLHLPVAYRSLSRPSSPLRAQAFTIRSYFTFFNLVN